MNAYLGNLPSRDELEDPFGKLQSTSIVIGVSSVLKEKGLTPDEKP